MTTSELLTQLLEKAKELPPEARRELAEELFDAGDALTHSSPWDDVIAQRVEAVRNGTATLLTTEECFEPIYKHLASLRR